MKILLVDAGNTSVKYRLVNAFGEILHELRWMRKDARPYADVLSALEADEIWISDVQGSEIPLPPVESIRYVHRDMRFPFSFSTTPGTDYGVDRLCMISALAEQYAQGFLLVCLGSAITYNVYHPNDGFIGGAISPGMQMRFQALHTFTGKLPLADNLKITHFPETETLQSLRCGVVEGILHEIHGFTETLLSSGAEGFQLILSGGDAPDFEKRLKYPYFAVPDLVLMGLYRLAILNRNV
jgi:type III pantothenate kinase